MATPTPQQIEAGLEELLAGLSDELRANQWIAEAGASKNRRFAALLKRVAAASSGEKSNITFNALDNLSKLGEPRRYFVDLALAHEENKWLAYHSILLLGCLGADHEIEGIMDEVETQSTDNQIRGAVAEVKRAAYLQTEFDELTPGAQQIDFVLRHFRSDWDPISLGDLGPRSTASPQAAWSQKTLHQLSAEYPQPAARAVHAVDLSDSYADPFFTRSYRAYLARFLSAGAREALAILEDQGED